MFYQLLFPLRDKFFAFNIFRYISFRTFSAALTAFVLTLLLLPVFIKKMKNTGHTERISEHVPQGHKKKEGTVTSGGLVFLPVVLISVFLWAIPWNPFVYLSLFVLLYLGILGYVDDRMKKRGHKKGGLSQKAKLLYQTILSVFVLFCIYRLYPTEYATSTQVLFFKNVFLELGVFYLLLVIFVFVGTTNAVNLTDGLDGLAAGASLPPMAVMLVVAYVTGHRILSNYLNILYIPGIGELSVFAGALIGALTGFLWFNSYPAEVFMGDTGSQALGGSLGILAILTKQELLLAVAGGLLVIEALSVILQVAYFRSTGGKRIFKKAPLHHHFEEKGWAEPKIVVRFWIISLVFAIIAISTLKIR